MISLLSDKQTFDISVHPEPDWATSHKVSVEVTWNGIAMNKGADLPKLDWDDAYWIFAEALDVNEHQLLSMSKGLDRGRTLRFLKKECRQSDLVKAGFISSDLKQ